MFALLRVRLYVCLCVGGWVFIRCVLVRSSLQLVHFALLLHCGYIRIVNIIKVCIERKNMRVELIRFHFIYSGLLLRREEFNSISLTERNPREWLSDSVYCHLYRWSHLSHIVHHSIIEWCASVFLSAVVFAQ